MPLAAAVGAAFLRSACSSTGAPLAAPNSAPGFGTVSDGGNVPGGTHSYAVTFTNAAGALIFAR